MCFKVKPDLKNIVHSISVHGAAAAGHTDGATTPPGPGYDGRTGAAGERTRGPHPDPDPRADPRPEVGPRPWVGPSPGGRALARG